MTGASLAVAMIGQSLAQAQGLVSKHAVKQVDLLVINKIDLAPFVGASLEVMDRDSKQMRAERPFLFANIRAGVGVEEIARFIETQGGLAALREHAAS